MLYSFLMLILFVVQGSIQPNIWTETKAFVEKWATVKAPGPIENAVRLGGDVSEVGTYEYALSLIDVEGKTSPMSDVVTVTQSLRSTPILAALPEYPTWTQTSGWVLWCRRITPFVDPDPPAGFLDFQWRPAGVQHNAGVTNATRPIMPIGGMDHHLRRHYHLMNKLVRWHAGGAFPEFSDNAFWPKSQILTEKPALPPLIQVQQFPNKRCLVAVSFACNLGETPLSTPAVVEQNIFGRNTHHQNVPYDGFSSGVGFRHLGKRETGALGYYVYIRFEEKNSNKGKWIRQPAPHVKVGTDTSKLKPDDFLWPLTITQFDLYRYVDSGIQPGLLNAQSLISPLQQALDAGVNHVLVTEDQTIYSPIVNELYNGNGTTIGRTILAPHRLPWKITTSSSAGGPDSWPIWCEVALKTSLIHCTMSSTHCRSGLDFATVYDSSNFSFRSEGLNVSLTAPGYTAGIIQRWESVSRWGHHTSETLCDRTAVQAAHPIVIEGNQAVNWRFTGEVHLYSTGGINSSLVAANNYMNVNFTRGELLLAGSDQYTAAYRQAALLNLPYDVWTDPDAFTGGRSIASLTSTNDFEVDNVFCDRGMPVWFSCSSYGSKRIRMNIKNVNQWANNLTVLENANGSKVGDIRLDVTGYSSRQNNPFYAVVSAGRPGYITVKRPEDLEILKNLVKHEPAPVLP